MFTLRNELYHAAICHFAVVLLLFLPIFIGLELVLKNESQKLFWQKLFLLNLYSGTFFLIVSIFLGDYSFEIIQKKITNISVVTKHEEGAYYALILYGIIIALNYFLKNRIRSYLLLVLTLVSSSLLLYVAHQGGKIVFDQGIWCPT